jgi:hypothetical protein
MIWSLLGHWRPDCAKPSESSLVPNNTCPASNLAQCSRLWVLRLWETLVKVQYFPAWTWDIPGETKQRASFVNDFSLPHPPHHEAVVIHWVNGWLNFLSCTGSWQESNWFVRRCQEAAEPLDDEPRPLAQLLWAGISLTAFLANQAVLSGAKNDQWFNKKLRATMQATFQGEWMTDS